jgi:hypothetical protein
MEENPVGGKVAGRLMYREVKIILKNESIRRFDPHQSVRVKGNVSQVSYRASVRERIIKLMYQWKVERKYESVPVQSTDVQLQNCIFTPCVKNSR